MAKTTACDICGQGVATSAEECPNCGSKIEGGFFRRLLKSVEERAPIIWAAIQKKVHNDHAA